MLLFTKVIRIPLIVRLPARLRDTLEADPVAPAYNTDLGGSRKTGAPPVTG